MVKKYMTSELSALKKTPQLPPIIRHTQRPQLGDANVNISKRLKNAILPV